MDMLMPLTGPRLIEHGFPCHQVGAETQRERGASSALPPLYFLHVWWARRPLTPSRAAREEEDERHISPLQLTVIRRSIDLWTNPGEIVFSPFAGIGSAGYIAIEMSRRFVGVELKRSYYEQAAANLMAAVSQRDASTLFA